jgi:hypothetical protein
MSHPVAGAVPPTTAFCGFCPFPSASLRPSHHLREGISTTTRKPPASANLRYDPWFPSVPLTGRVRDDRVDPSSSPQRTLSNVVHQTIAPPREIPPGQSACLSLRVRDQYSVLLLPNPRMKPLRPLDSARTHPSRVFDVHRYPTRSRTRPNVQRRTTTSRYRQRGRR